MGYGLRQRRLAVSAAFHLLVLSLGLLAVFTGIKLSIHLLFDAGGLLVLAHLLTFQRLRLGQFLEQRLLRDWECDQCGLTLDLVASWTCGCKYTSNDRHAFSPCPQCVNKGFAWIACPRCGTGILI